MTCPDEAFFLAFLQGDLLEAEEERFIAHLDGCPECRRLLSALGRARIDDGDLGARGEGPPVTPDEATAAMSETDGSPTLTGSGSTHDGDRAEVSLKRFVPLQRGDSVGRYLVLSPVGSGGMGVVYAAHDPDLDRKVALKILRPELYRSRRSEGGSVRLQREARSMARLSHSNVIAIYDVGTFEEKVFLAMEFVEGPTLDGWLQKQPRTWREILGVFVAAGEGLAAAHRAGLVHRDFKPGNVLIGPDAQVKVTDFGLARSLATPPEEDDGIAPSPGESDSPAGWADITRPGAVVGTPAYMPPEQHRGGQVDARTDQFSFCLALYEALYGERPFAGEGLEDLRAAVQAGRVLPPPRGSNVPSWLRRALLRGLAPQPDQRFPSMEPLLAILRAGPKRARRWWATAALLVVAALFVGLLIFRPEPAPRPVCQGAPRKLAGIWDDARRRGLRAALLATGKPFASAVWERTRRLLNAYAQRWVSAHTDACTATRIRGEQSEELMDLRVRCLMRRRSGLEALTSLLLRADAAMAAKAVQAVHGLGDLSVCSNPEWLTARVRPPSDPTAGAEVDEVGSVLARAKALLRVGRFAQGLKVAGPLVKRAERLGYRPLQAEVHLVVGRIQAAMGRPREARKSLMTAVWRAQAGRHDRVVVDASSWLVRITGYQLSRFEEAHQWAAQARASLERVGGDRAREAALLTHLGGVLRNQDRLDDAVTHLRRALAIRESILPTGHPEIASSLTNLALALWNRGRQDEAIAAHRRALQIVEHSLGQRHPHVATVLNNLAIALRTQGRLRESLEIHRRALSIRRSALPRDHPDLAVTLSNLATVLIKLGRVSESLDPLEKALRIREKVYGPKSRFVMFTLMTLATATSLKGQFRRALKLMKRAHEIARSTLGETHRYTGYSLNGLGNIHRRNGTARQAIPYQQRALRVLEPALGAKHPAVAKVRIDYALALLAGGRGTEAVGPARRALRDLVANKGSRGAIAQARFALARGLWLSVDGRKEALALAREALRANLARGAAARDEVKRIRAWLGERSPR